MTCSSPRFGAHAARYSSTFTVVPRHISSICWLAGRPAEGAWVNAGVGDGQRQLAQCRYPLVDPAAGAVEAIAHRVQAGHQRWAAVRRELAPEGMLGRQTERVALQCPGGDGLTQLEQQELQPAGLDAGLLGQAHADPQQRGAIAAQDERYGARPAACRCRGRLRRQVAELGLFLARCEGTTRVDASLLC